MVNVEFLPEDSAFATIKFSQEEPSCPNGKLVAEGRIKCGRFEFIQKDSHTAEFLIDGKKVTGIRGFTFESRVGEMPVMSIEFFPTLSDLGAK